MRFVTEIASRRTRSSLFKIIRVLDAGLFGMCLHPDGQMLRIFRQARIKRGGGLQLPFEIKSGIRESALRGLAARQFEIEFSRL